MIFPHSFYEDEVRSDFLIPSMVKRTWAAQIQILADLDEACSRYGLEYYAEWGTLLGTVRHGGFIPWDDDMDVCMKRRDYEYLIDNVSSILPDNYSIVSFRSNRDFKQMLCRIVSSDHYRFDAEYMKKYSGLPFSLGIDIFPLDFLTDDEEYERSREERATLVYQVVNEIGIYNTPLSSLEKYLRDIESKCGIKIDRKGDVLTQLRHLLEKIFGEVEEKDARYITLYPLWLDAHKYRFPVDHYGAGLRMRFEHTSVRVPVCYDAILTVKYGSSYMDQVRSGGAHDYPYFENHVNILRDDFGFEWPAYKFDPNDLPEHREERSAKDGGRVLFITYDIRAYENMQTLVRHYVDNGYEVTVLPVTKYDIAPDMTGITVSDERISDDRYTENLPGIKVTHDQGILGTHPDVIVTDYPYDEYNLITTVDQAYYSRALRSCTDWLVYVPPFEAKSMAEDDERAKKLMPLYVWTPLPVVSDEIILHSDEMKKRYVESLVQFSNDTYRQVWEDKITVAHDVSPVESAAEPGTRRKVMFYIGIASFAQYGSEMIGKLRNVIEIFDENKDSIECIFKEQEGLRDNLKRMYPSLYDEYMACGLCESTDTNICDIDAYYGEASEFATGFMDAYKPVMIMSI